MFSWIFGKKPVTPPGTGQGHDIELPAEPKSTGATTASDRAITLIKREEGFDPVAVRDVDGVLILGHGSKIIDGKPVVAGQTIDAANADRNVREHAVDIAAAILRMVHVPLSQGQLDALVDFVYNVGTGALQQSTLLRTINSQQQVIERYFTMWNKIHKPSGEVVELPGLTERRQAEYQLWIS